MNFDFNSFMQQLIIQAPPLLFALTVHELAHGYVAFRLGDPTAKNEGRLTLNPLKHLDPLGVLAFIIMKIGWAKPVPVNPWYFRNPRQDMLKVALAGPGANVVLAIASASLAHLFVQFRFLPFAVLQPLVAMLAASVWINIMLAVFNCIPIPPLDGSKVLMGLLPPEAARSYAKLEPFGFFILLGLFYTGVIGWLIMPIIRMSNALLLG
ncbi:peptidase M50 [Desulfobulbus propionicus DSM 2032]|jgi:Zn-dependent protease|uniref:Peptidase M50 n=1 Tax=Desulfobulbus propionicus (strain ATCC 33891 / DSM 2032 / VKM B-1956 / 1pr3) TaxID=577650 RepID=A0A7U3YPJ1_DESPD|nr:site-2 protease family protein [Desulfobulbus propionicus]ADW19043.1 peptidase M50 [Desulfobulbus propionicus DSM 2032]